MSLLRALADYKLPSITYYCLTKVPADSELVRTFIASRSQSQKHFYFNWDSSSKVESNKYIQVLKTTAVSTAENFGVNHLSFSGGDFTSLVVSAKNVVNLSIRSSLIPLDCNFEFGMQLYESKIQYLDMSGCGSADCGDWAENESCFEFLLEAISKSLPLRNSLNMMNIQDCGVSKEKVDQIRMKYGLNSLFIFGV